MRSQIQSLFNCLSSVKTNSSKLTSGAWHGHRFTCVTSVRTVVSIEMNGTEARLKNRGKRKDFCHDMSEKLCEESIENARIS